MTYEPRHIATALTDGDAGLISAVWGLASGAHHGQVDKQGRDYYTHHLLPVADLLRPYGAHAYMAGLLHDVIEDTKTTYADLRALEIPEPVIDAIWAVTRRTGEPYEALIRRAAQHPLGRLVKLADNWVNLTGLDDLAKTDAATATRLKVRYEKARAVLEQALAEPPPPDGSIW